MWLIGSDQSLGGKFYFNGLAQDCSNSSAFAMESVSAALC